MAQKRSRQSKLKRDSKIRRQVDLELGIEPYKTKVHRNKTKYKRKNKHKDDYEQED